MILKVLSLLILEAHSTLPLGTYTDGKPYQRLPYQGERRVELLGLFKL